MLHCFVYLEADPRRSRRPGFVGEALIVSPPPVVWESLVTKPSSYFVTPLPPCIVFSNPFICNTYGTPRKCCKQKTYRMRKPFSCNTYKKQGYPLKPSNFLCPHSAQVLSFHTLAHSFARTKTQLVCFQSISHSLPKNTGRGGGGVLVTNRLLTLGGGSH